MGVLHSLLGAVGLTSAGHARALMKRVAAADERVSALTRDVTAAREEATRWKSRAEALAARVSTAERAAGQLPSVERELQRWKTRDEKHTAQLAEVRERMIRAERAAELSQEHLTATEAKLDVIEAAIGVLDRRTRQPL